MDSRLLKHFNSELQHLRDMGAEFANEFPKIAGRLGIDGDRVADPYVERLLEGFSFLTARIQLRMDAEFPTFTQHLLEMVYPHYLAPTPSMCVVQFHPNLKQGSLNDGFLLPRGTSLHSLLGKKEQTTCEYRTAHDVTLWPLEIEEAQYFDRAETTLKLPLVPTGVKAGIRLRLKTTNGSTFDKLSLDQLPVYLSGQDQERFQLYSQLFGAPLGVVICPADLGPEFGTTLDSSHIQPVGFDDEQALLPVTKRSFQGYRLLDEYFVFPERFMFFNLVGLSDSLRKCTGNRVEIIVLLGKSDRMLQKVIEAHDFRLFCSPAINLFPKRTDRIHLSDGTDEFHIVPDRSRPLDFEVHSVTGVSGFGPTCPGGKEFFPFYGLNDQNRTMDPNSYYTIRRQARVLPAQQRPTRQRTGYIGTEAYVSLVDGSEGPFAPDLRQLGIETLCTNRDLPLRMAYGQPTTDRGQANTDFTLKVGAPVLSVRILNGPTRPKPSRCFAPGEVNWRLVNHLSLNYLSLIDTDGTQGASALRELLTLYADVSDPSIMKQVDGLKSITSRPIVRRMKLPGPITYTRGLEIELLVDEAAFKGTCTHLFGAVLEVFLARYVSMNSFTELALRTDERGEVYRWPMRIGRRHRL